MNQETKIQNAILLALSESGCKVWRVETAGGWVGKTIHKAGDQITLTNARMFTTGLCKGGSDIIGITPDGRFLAIEVKTPTGRATSEQLAFIETVKAQGGVAGIARSVEDALQLIAHT